MKRVLRLACALGIVVLSAIGAPGVQAGGDAAQVVVGGLNNPTGVLVEPDGTLWVAESGLAGTQQVIARNFDIGKDNTPALIGNTATVLRIDPNGTRTIVAQLPSVKIGMMIYGAHHIAQIGDTIYVPTTAWTADVKAERPRYAATVVRIKQGQLSQVADLYEYEQQNNPDQHRIESDPFGVAVGPDGKLWVTEAGANTILKIDPDSGAIDLMTVFHSLSSPIPNPNRNGQMSTDIVPTGIVFDKSGSAYVGFLSGFPFIPGSAAIVKLSADGRVTPYASHLNMITDVAFGPDDNLYATVYGDFTGSGFDGTKGKILRIKDGKASEVVVENVDSPSALAFNQAGDAFVATKSASGAGQGQIVRFPKLVEQPSIGRAWTDQDDNADTAWVAPNEQLVAGATDAATPFSPLIIAALGITGGAALLAGGVFRWRVARRTGQAG